MPPVNYENYKVGNDYIAWYEVPISILSSEITDLIKWAKNYQWDEILQQDIVVTRTVSEYISHYIISSNQQKALLFLQAIDNDPILMEPLTLEALTWWVEDVFPKTGYISNKMKTQAEVDTLIANGTYGTYSFGRYTP